MNKVKMLVLGMVLAACLVPAQSKADLPIQNPELQINLAIATGVGLAGGLAEGLTEKIFNVSLSPAGQMVNKFLTGVLVGSIYEAARSNFDRANSGYQGLNVAASTLGAAFSLAF